MKTAKEFYNDTEYPKAFTKLTSTGISDNFENVFEFAEAYANSALQEAEKYKQSLIKRTESMEEFGEDFFGNDDFQDGNSTALKNMRVHINDLFPFKTTKK